MFKKIMFSFLLSIFVFTLAACNGEEEPSQEELLNDAKSEAAETLEGHVDLSNYSPEVQDYISNIQDNWVDRIDDATSVDEVEDIKNNGLTRLDELISIADGDTFDEELCAIEETPFDVCYPTINGLPEDNTLTVSRGFTGNLSNHFSISANDFKGNNITSLMVIKGDIDFQTTGDYDITFEVVDENNRTVESSVITVEVESLNEAPTINVQNDEMILSMEGASDFDLLEGLSAFDAINLDITSTIEYNVYDGAGNDVSFENNPGFYKVEYFATDMDNNVSEKIYREITVMPGSVAYRSDDIDRTFAEEPGLLYLQINAFLDWEPREDDEYTGIATIPLQERMTGEAINPNVVNNDVGLALLDVFMPLDSNLTPRHKGYDAYTVEYWQYIDVAVAWGGQISSFTIPSREQVNAAHKNGIPILGNIFMAPTAFGGNISNTEKMVEKDDDGNFPVADQMITMAKYFGFDGWFINLETDPGESRPDLAEDFIDFLHYLQDEIDERYPEMIIQHYDSIRDDGRIAWQGSLNDRNDMFFQDDEKVLSDSLFLDFRWDGRYGGGETRVEDARERAIELGRSPYELYTGFDTQQYGYEKSSNTATPWQWDRFVDPDTLEPYTSIGIYRSDWTFNLDGASGGNSYDNFVETAQDYWVGFERDPRKSFIDLENDPNGWYGISAFVAERTTLIGDSMFNRFNTGNGHQFYYEGEVVSEFDEGWNNLSIQDIMPHFRWINDSQGSGEPLDIAFDHDSAYYGGSSLKLFGDISSDNATDFKVFKTYLNIHDDTSIQLYHKANDINASVHVRLTLESDSWFETVEYLPLSLSDENTWELSSIDLSEFTGETITSIGFLVESSQEINDYQINIDDLMVHRGLDDKNESIIENIAFDEVGFQYGITADVRLKWDPLTTDEIVQYDVYNVNEDGTKQYLSSSYHNRLYVNDIQRQINNDGDQRSDYLDESTIVLKAYNDQGQQIGEGQKTLHWEEPIEGGRAGFDVSRTVIGEGETIIVSANVSSITESIEWDIEGGTIVNGDIHSEEIEVQYDHQGVFSIGIITTNRLGTNDHYAPHAVTVSNAASTVSNVAASGRIDSYSGYFAEAAQDERPRNIIDGDYQTKWTETDATTSGDKWVIIDLRGIYVVSEIALVHASESFQHYDELEWNTVGYNLYVSLDKEEWINITEVDDNEDGITSHAFSPTNARYVKLVVTNGSQIDNHARIQEVEVYGRIAN